MKNQTLSIEQLNELLSVILEEDQLEFDYSDLETDHSLEPLDYCVNEYTEDF